MPSASSPSGRAGGGRRWCARGDLLTLAIAAMLCSATYCFSIWHNGRNAPDKIVIGPASFVPAGATRCGGDADANAVELDFEAHHTAERAGLSVSSSTAAPATVAGRRALRSAAEPVDTGRRGVASGNGWTRVDGDKFLFTYDGAVRV
uniref:Uncharacterized protein n=1 Tax=Avena sativa TaxID=4498 RepID=A0ACD5U5R3_AVESA